MGRGQSFTMTRERLKVVIIGAGKGGRAILEIFKDDPSVKVVGMADINPSAEGLEVARKLHIPITGDYRKLLHKKGLDIIVNVTGSREVEEALEGIKPPGVEVIGGVSAKVLWQLIEERRKRMEERERALKEHEALYRLGLTVEGMDNLKEVGIIIIDYAIRLTNTSAGSLAIFDEKRGEMVMVASKGFSPGFTKVERWKVRKGGLTSYILNQTGPVEIPDLRRHPGLNPLLIKEGVISLLGAPLTIEGKIMGVLYVNDFKMRRFTREEVSLFSILTIYAPLTIERFKYFGEMKLLSITDGLTGLYNHRYFMEQLQKELERASRHNHPFSLIMLDIDRFKDYNDRFGHLEGNKVLKGIGGLLRKNSRAIDTVARFGGEEFSIILPEIGKEGATSFANRLVKKIAKHPFPKRRVTVSGGVATFSQDGSTVMELIRRADTALYEAKRLGRDRIISH